MTIADGRAATSPMRTGAITITLCFLVALFEGIDLQAAGVAAPRIAPLFNLSPGQLGLFFSASTLGVLFGAAAGGPAADWLGRKPALVISLATFGVGSIATALSWSFIGLVASRGLTGLGLGGALPVAVALVVENAAPKWRNTAVGITYAGFPIGGALISLLSSLTSGWQIAFLVGGFGPLLLAPALWLWLPESAEFNREMANRSRGILPDKKPSLLGKTTFLLWAAFFATLLALYLLLNWMPSLLVGLGFTKAHASVVQIAFNVGGAFGSIGLGALMDGRYRGTIVGIVYGSIVLGLVMLANIPSALPLAVLVGGFIGLALVGAQTILYGLAPRCFPTVVRGRGVGSAVVAGRVGSILGPLLAAFIIGSGGGMIVVWRLIPIIVVAAACAVVLVHRTRAEA